ncbi:MAG TPA: LysR family transcriptional regulator [Aliidongia sp.]|nr:LysR family transcriptional regulator [Aliidongia sp.]
MRYFVAVAEELHFSRAARRLHMAQPPLSQQIRNLEAELGMQLLARGRRPLRLTEAGRFFKNQALEILAKLDEAIEGARRISRDQNDWIGIGYIGSAMNMLLPPVLRRFHAERPGVEVLLYEMSYEAQKAALLEGRIHVGFVDLSLGTDVLAEELLYEEPMTVAVPQSHPLADRTEISLAELAAQPMVLCANSTSRGTANDYLISLIRAAGFEPKIAMEAQNVESALGLVVAGLGIALAVESFANTKRAGICFVSLGRRGPSVPMNAVYRPDERFSSRTAFLNIVREESSLLSESARAA